MGIINFKGVSFQNGVDFKATNFIKYANLCGVQFEESANFSQAVFCETADFERSEFFWESRFHGSRFIKKADFSGAVFRGNTWFSESYFSLDANFYEAEFKNEAYFTKAYFGDRLNLDKSKINYVSLADITCGKNCHITLQASNFTRLEARWDSLRNYLIYDGPMYLSLTKNYNNLEWFEDADDCYYHYRIEKRAGLNAWSKILDYIIWVAYGYGVRPQNPLMLGVILVLLSAFIFWLGSQRQSMTDSLYLSVIVFISSPEIDQLTGLCKLWGLFERLMGWLLMALFLVTLGRVTIR